MESITSLAMACIFPKSLGFLFYNFHKFEILSFRNYFYSMAFIFDFYLALISAIIGFFLLLILLIIKNTSFQSWIIRKIVHFLGGTFIAIVVPFYSHYLGVLLAIAFFLLNFIVLILCSQTRLLKEYFILRNCRKNEKNYSFLFNTIATLLVLLVIYLVSNFLFNDVLLFSAAALIISWADTAGEVIGRSIPSIDFQIFGKKSLAGSFGVLLASVASFFVISSLMGLSVNELLILKIITSSIVCSIVEILSWGWIDNLLLPVIGIILMLWII